MFNTSLAQSDPDLFSSIINELRRQQDQIELIASENIVSKAVLQAQGSILTNKYAEGYPGNRYYCGCEHVDVIEKLAIDRLTKLFNCVFANVQPHSGAQANQAVMLALVKPGETIMGMSLNAGGHLSHGASVNLSGKWFHAVSYEVNPETYLLDYDAIEALANAHSPRLIIAGGSAYPRQIDFARFRKIADGVGAYLMVDMAHFSGLVAGGILPSPLPHAHVVTSTTHKTLRGPRGGIILSNDADLGKKINSAVFPGLQGGPLMHVIAAKAVAFGEALKDDFKTYVRQVVDNAQALGQVLVERGFKLISGGTDTHLLLVDLTNYHLTGKDASYTLESANITCNKNGIPFDPLPPAKTSGIRLGSPAITTRGFKQKECEEIGHMVADILQALQQKSHASAVEKVKHRVQHLCQQFPIYKDLYN
jgi:glycine hydroxymethyltransferase